MLLIFHILIAVSSLIFSGYTFFLPTKRKVQLSTSLILMTFVSGIYLVIQTHSPLLAACTSGLLYLSVVLTATVAAYQKLPGSEKSGQ